MAGGAGHATREASSSKSDTRAALSDAAAQQHAADNSTHPAPTKFTTRKQAFPIWNARYTTVARVRCTASIHLARRRTPQCLRAHRERTSSTPPPPQKQMLPARARERTATTSFQTLSSFCEALMSTTLPCFRNTSSTGIVSFRYVSRRPATTAGLSSGRWYSGSPVACARPRAQVGDAHQQVHFREDTLSQGYARARPHTHTHTHTHTHAHCRWYSRYAAARHERTRAHARRPSPPPSAGGTTCGTTAPTPCARAGR